MENLKYAFVGCSSSKNTPDFFYESAIKLGLILSENNFNLVFGACNNGLMGEIYRTMKKNNSKIIGISTNMYKDDFKELECDEEYITTNTNERINLMYSKSNILIFLPGATGTLEEIVIAIEKKRTNEIDLPIIIFDENNYYLPLIEQLINLERYGFSNNCNSLYEYINDEEILKQHIKKLSLKC